MTNKRRKLPEPDLTDPDNPEWTEADFARAVGPEALSDIELAAFPKTQVNRGGRPKLDRPKAPVNIRLDADLADHLRSSGRGWQTKANDILVKAYKAGEL